MQDVWGKHKTESFPDIPNNEKKILCKFCLLKYLVELFRGEDQRRQGWAGLSAADLMVQKTQKGSCLKTVCMYYYMCWLYKPSVELNKSSIDVVWLSWVPPRCTHMSLCFSAELSPPSTFAFPSSAVCALPTVTLSLLENLTCAIPALLSQRTPTARWELAGLLPCTRPVGSSLPFKKTKFC